jgi:hypothetical protein
MNVEQLREFQKFKITLEYETELETLNYRAGLQEKTLQSYFTERDDVEKEFPEILNNVYKRIKKAAEQNTNMYEYTMTGGVVKETFIVGMLISVLPLQGYVCKLRENKLNISW